MPNYGQQCKNLIGGSLQIKGKTAIDRNCNLKVEDAKVKGDAEICGDLVVKGCITSCGSSGDCGPCPPVTIKILWNLPPTLELTKVWTDFIDKIRTNSLGTIEAELVNPADLGIPAANIQDRIAYDLIPVGDKELIAGAVFSYGETWNGDLKEFSCFLSGQIPFGMTYPQYITWYAKGGGKEAEQQVLDNVYGAGTMYSEVFGAGGGPEVSGFFPANFAAATTYPEVNDLSGSSTAPGKVGNFKFRSQNIGRLVLQEAFPKWEVVPGVPGLSPLAALCDGQLDGFEFSDPATNDALVFPDETTNPVACGAPYYYLSGWHGPATVLRFVMNTKYHNMLSPFQKRVLEQTLTQCTDDSFKCQSEAAGRALDSRMKIPYYASNLCLRSRHTSNIVAHLKASTQTVLATESAADTNFELLLDSYTSYMSNVGAWILNSEYNDSDRFEQSYPSFTLVPDIDNC